MDIITNPDAGYKVVVSPRSKKLPLFSISAQVTPSCDMLSPELTRCHLLSKGHRIEEHRTEASLIFHCYTEPQDKSDYEYLLHYLIANLKHPLSENNPIILRGNITPQTQKTFYAACETLAIPEKAISKRFSPYEPRLFKSDRPSPLPTSSLDPRTP